MVKLEGGASMVETVRFLTERGIPVCGHIGLTPQSVHQLGGYRVQGRESATAQKLLEDAVALEQAGAGMIVLEAMPALLAAEITFATDHIHHWYRRGCRLFRPSAGAARHAGYLSGQESQFRQELYAGCTEHRSSGCELRCRSKGGHISGAGTQLLMQVVSTIAELRTRLADERAIAFVPTMGNLHEGHLNLMRLAREHGSCVVASIFVNPLQFGPSEDFDRYPRTLEADCAKLQGLADLVFVPSVNEMYPAQQTVFVEPSPIANELEGVSRPGHFRGMATVVLKLLNIVQPQVAVFGKKDYQQLHVIRQMAAQLNMPVRIVGGETVRAVDGLALSSRNQYLNESERGEAVFLYQTLQELRQAMLQGKRDVERLQQQAVKSLVARGWSVDYVEVRNQSDLLPASELKSDLAQRDPAQRNLVVLAAASLGNTRLIDNIEV